MIFLSLDQDLSIYIKTMNEEVNNLKAMGEKLQGSALSSFIV